MAASDSLQWSQVAAKAAGMKVVTPSRSSRDSATMSSDILFELPEFSQQQLARKAAAIIRQALSPDTVLFSFPRSSFSHHTEAYKLIVDQIGPLASVRPLSNYDVRARRDLLIAAKFTCSEHTTTAIDSGVTIDNVIYKASPTSSGIENPLMRVQLNLLHNADDRYIKEDLLSSLRYYGKVYQIRRILCNGYFEGQLTVILDPSEGYMIGNQHHNSQPLQRMLYLETWDVFAPASFKGADPICFYCRQAGHVRNTCPQLAKRVCFGCGETGHIRRFCKTKMTQPTVAVENESELLDNYVKDSVVIHKDKDLDKNLQQEESISTLPMEEETDEEHEASEESDKDMELESGEQETSAKETDPSISTLASKWAPDDIATTMRVDDPKEMIISSDDDTTASPTLKMVDSQAEMLSLTKVKATTKTKSDTSKRRLVKSSASTYKVTKATDASIFKPVFPSPITKPQSSARRA